MDWLPKSQTEIIIDFAKTTSDACNRSIDSQLGSTTLRPDTCQTVTRALCARIVALMALEITLETSILMSQSVQITRDLIPKQTVLSHNP